MLLDTQFLVWTALHPELMSERARKLVASNSVSLTFSWVSLWEVAIKSSLGRPNFNVDVNTLHARLLSNGFASLPIKLEHLSRVAGLPFVHRDPFDRLLVAQAAVERMVLLTSDRALSGYGAMVKVI